MKVHKYVHFDVTVFYFLCRTEGQRPRPWSFSTRNSPSDLEQVSCFYVTQFPSRELELEFLPALQS